MDGDKEVFSVAGRMVSGWQGDRGEGEKGHAVVDRVTATTKFQRSQAHDEWAGRFEKGRGCRACSGF